MTRIGNPSLAEDWTPKNQNEVNETIKWHLKNIYNLMGSSHTQVNSDWNATEGPAEILNKPTIPEGPLVVQITMDANHNVTLLDGAPTKAEILSALQSGRQVIGLEYEDTPKGYMLERQMLCTGEELGYSNYRARFFAIKENTIDYYGVLDLY